MPICLRINGLAGICLLSVIFLCGCAGTENSLREPKSKSYLYPLTPEQALVATYSGISEVSGGVYFQIPPPGIGYVASKQVLSDQHTWRATALLIQYPLTNKTEIATAFAFEVKHSGTLIEGPFTASKIFKAMSDTAESMCQPIELTPYQVARCKKASPFSAFKKVQRKPSSDVQASGTGFFITDDGYFISNYHVVESAAKIQLVTSAGTLDAKVVQTDSANDLALLKADGRFSPLPVASSRTVVLGSTVATVGFPDPGLQGFLPKLAKGEISALAGARDDVRYFQVSVPVQPGNSGGALVDARGNAVGIVSAKLDAATALAASGALPENVNYAVKSSYLLSFLESAPEVAKRLKEPKTAEEKFEDVVKDAEAASALVLVY